MIQKAILESPDFKRLQEKISNGGEKILIISHRNPDGDAMGSSLAMYNFLTPTRNTVNLMVPNDFPAFLKWMKSAGRTVIFSKEEERAVKLLEAATIIFTLDFNDPSRVKEFEEHVRNSRAFKVLIDHHPYPEEFADISVSQTEVSSTAELVYEFMLALGLSVPIDKDIAECIYTGIMTDTGCFSFNSSRPETYRILSDLLSLNIEKDKVYDFVYDNFTYERMRLMGHCLDAKMKYLPQFRAAFITLTQTEMREYNFRVGDSEGFVNLPLSIKGVVLSALFTEKADMVKISLRSKGDFAVNRICSDHFNGGGHINAAGGESYETLQKTVEKFISILPEYQEELRNV